MLRRPWLLFFLALTLAAEGFLVSAIIVEQSGSTVFITQEDTTPQVASVGSVVTSSLKAGFEGLERQLMRLSLEPQDITTALLASVAFLVLVLVLFSFFLHVQIQSGDLLLGGTAVAGFAFMLLLLNTHLVGVPAGTETAALFLAW